MAKRFTETKKWTVSFRKLPPRLKCVLAYLYDFCDHAGLWDVDYEAMSLYIGEPVHEAEVLEAYGWRIVPVVGGTKYFLPEFMLWNYKKKNLNPAINAHRSALELLAEVGIKDWTIYLEQASAGPEPVQGLMTAVLEAPARAALPPEEAGPIESAKASMGKFFAGLNMRRRLDD